MVVDIAGGKINSSMFSKLIESLRLRQLTDPIGNICRLAAGPNPAAPLGETCVFSCGATTAVGRPPETIPYAPLLFVDNVGGASNCTLRCAAFPTNCARGGREPAPEVGTTSARPSGPVLDPGRPFQLPQRRSRPRKTATGSTPNRSATASRGPCSARGAANNCCSAEKPSTETTAFQSRGHWRPLCVEPLNSRSTMTRMASPPWQRAKPATSEQSGPSISSAR
jgi:hypothetical protein